MRRIGVHTSIAGGLHMALRRAHALGCTTAQIFSHNPRAWKTDDISANESAMFKRLRRELDIAPVYVHASYLLNVASASRELWDKSVCLLAEEMRRADSVGADFVVLHTGSARDPRGLERACAGIRRALGQQRFEAGLLVENTSGKQGDIASSVEELARIMEGAGGLPAGLCIDSCHAFAAGYDIRSPEGVDALSQSIGRLLGKDAVKLIHLNDSKGGLGSGRDRHEHIGKGMIGNRGLAGFINHPSFKIAHIILETPKDDDASDGANLSQVRELSAGRLRTQR